MAHFHRIVSWYGSHSIDKINSATVGITSSYREEQLVDQIGVRNEGEELIRYLILHLRKKGTFSILLCKINNKVNFGFFSDVENISDLPSGIITEKDPLIDESSLPELVRIDPGYIDIFRMSSQYPSTLLKDAINWSNESGVLLKFNSLENDPYLKWEDIKNNVLELATNVNFLNTYSDSRTTTTSKEGHIGNKIVDQIFGGKSSSTSENRQSQFQGSLSLLDEIEELCNKVILPNLNNKNDILHMSVSSFGDIKSVLNSFNELMSPAGKSLNLSWIDYERDLKIDLSKFNSSSNPKVKERSQSIRTSLKKVIKNTTCFITPDTIGRVFALSPYQLSTISYNWLPVLNLKRANFENEVKIGEIYDKNKPVNSFIIDQNVIPEHLAVLGQTGTGKTNTIKTITSKVASDENVKCLVIESSKNEYNDFDSKLKFNHIVIGEDVVRLPLFATYYILEKNKYVSEFLSSHIGNLWNSFSGAFPLEGPMIMILQRAIENAYVNLGWYRCEKRKAFVNDYGAFWPDIDDLINEIKRECQTLGYKGELRANIEAALTNRLNLLKSGIWKNIFKSNKAEDLDLIFKHNTIICLDQLTADDDKSLLISLLFNHLRLYVRNAGWSSSHNKLNYFLVIEEAHRIIPNIDTSTTSSSSQQKNKEVAVSNFNNGIAEFRSYGVGICVADQSPSKISMDVLRNVGTKIIHSVQERDDQLKAGSILGLSEEESSTLSALPDRGFALVKTRSQLIQRPSLVKIQKFISSSPEVFKCQFHDHGTPVTNDDKTLVIKLLSFKNLELKTKQEVDLYLKFRNTDYKLKKYEEISTKISRQTSIPFKSCKDCKVKCTIPATLFLMSEDQKDSAISPTTISRSFFNFINEYSDKNITQSNNRLVPLAESALCNYVELKKIDIELSSSTLQNFSYCVITHTKFNENLLNLSFPLNTKAINFQKEISDNFYRLVKNFENKSFMYYSVITLLAFQMIGLILIVFKLF